MEGSETNQEPSVIETIFLSQHPCIVTIINYVKQPIEPEQMFFDTPKRDYEAFMKNHPRWPRCLSIPYNGRLVWTCHEELAQKALKEIKSIKRVVNDLKCPQCGEKEIIYEISHAYIQMGGDGGQRKYYKVFFVCGDYLEIPLNTET